jgi:hypothetical protein
MSATYFGTRSSVGDMSNDPLPKPSSSVVHFEAFCNNAGAAATVTFYGSISGATNAWTSLGTISLTGTTVGTLVVSTVNHSYYKATVTAISGAGAVATAFMGN